MSRNEGSQTVEILHLRQAQVLIPSDGILYDPTTLTMHKAVHGKSFEGQAPTPHKATWCGHTFRYPFPGLPQNGVAPNKNLFLLIEFKRILIPILLLCLTTTTGIPLEPWMKFVFIIVLCHHQRYREHPVHQMQCIHQSLRWCCL